ncbi:MAG: methyltransferase domain-containing protein [Pyrinomonadaceae bacterium]|nr:methyltransferase domain-containing protein [Pyrinomonadaceae bacterium]
MVTAKRECIVPCNLCGSMEVEEISRVDRDKNYLRTVICKRCGLAWSDPRPDAEEVKKFYSKDYRILYKGAYSPKLKHVYRAGKVAAARYAFLNDVIKPDDAVLDIGSGGGEFVYLMRKLGFDGKGIEPNEGYGLYAKMQLELPIEVGFAQQLDLQRDSYNVITLHHVMEHLDDPSLILERIRDALRDDGILVVEVPNIEGTCFAPTHRFHVAHLYSFNQQTLEAMGRKAGFKVHKTIISSDGGVITTMFRKTERSGTVDAAILGNYERIIKILKEHTNVSHYLTLNPYVRPIRRLRMYVDEAAAIRNRASGKEVLDHVISKQTGERKS